MARALLIIALGVLAPGCVDAPILQVDAPLLVFNTYPANGATIARGDLGELAVTFSADLGPEAQARDQANDRLTLAGARGPLPVVRGDAGNVAYDQDTFTLRVVLDPEVLAQLTPGRWTLTVGRGFEAADGRPLPTDYAARFTVTPQ